MKKMLGYAAVAALFWTASANASTISITLSETGFAPLTVSASSFIGSYGTYSNVGVQAFGPFSPDLLNSNILTKQGSGTGALTITVNETGLVHPLPN